ncbi:MAG: methyltransferase domain-containing protein [Candidatus Omnitrophota bacterium]|nr:methyltransferase domain-containing protein [Candidatus Omnitrophota bacterium]
MINRKEVEMQDKVSEYYEAVRYKKDYSVRYHEWWIKKMISMSGINGGRVLDNGCGTGILFDYLRGYDCMVTGMDISSGMLEKAKKINKNTVCGDSQELPFKDGSFDIIYARSLLHHLPDHAKGVKEMKRVARGNGRIVFVDTNDSILSRLPRMMVKDKGHFSEEHKNFRIDELMNIISREFRITGVYFFGYIAYPLLGFPDLIDIFKYAPFKGIVSKILIKIDEVIAAIPFVKKNSWGVMICARKEEDGKGPIC